MAVVAHLARPDVYGDIRARLESILRAKGIPVQLLALLESAALRDGPTMPDPLPWERLSPSQRAALCSTVEQEHGRLFSQHRNLVSLMPVALPKDGSVDGLEPCIVALVLARGLVPLGDSALPTKLGEFRLRVWSADPPCTLMGGQELLLRDDDYLRPPWAIQLSLGQTTDDGITIPTRGTAGAFVRDANNTIYLLTCAHVLFLDPENDLVPMSPVEVKIRRPWRSKPPSQHVATRLGSTTRAVFGDIHVDHLPVGMDAAVTRLEDTAKSYG